MNPLNNIDWQWLREQKHTLLTIIAEKRSVHLIEVEEQVDDLEGLVSLIDSLQDYAVDELGIPEEEVFNFENEEQ